MITGLFVGKFLPLHKGHIFAITKASKECDKLYVVVGENPTRCRDLCNKANIPYIDLQLKTTWLREELKNLKNIVIVPYDETGISAYPYTSNSWKNWAEGLKKLIDDKIDIIFSSEPTEKEPYEKYFPTAKFQLQDADRTTIPISATLIRQNWQEHFDFIADSAKPWFDNLRK